jgi:transposase
LRFRFQHVHPFSKGVWANAAQPFERFGFEMLNLLLGHRLCLLDLLVLIFQTFARGLLIAFHQSAYRNFKWFYTQLVCRYWRKAFPGLVSYNRSVEWMPSALIPLCAYLRRCFGKCTGLSFIDATSIKVCHNRRIASHKVFNPLAARGKTSVDWFFGFKLHLVINEQGELLNVQLTPGNTDDRKPVPHLLQRLFEKVVGDRGYLSQKLAFQLWQNSGIQLIINLKRNMKNRLMVLSDKLLLRRRAVIESVIDQLKNISQIVAFASSLARQLPGQLSLRVDRLLPPTQEALSAH